MVAAGFDCVVRAEDMAVMGITEVVRHLPRIYREFRKLKQSVRDRRPDVAVLIDFPDIHFRLAEEFHRLGVPVVFFVSPQLWAWKKHRIKLVQKYVDRMLVIFPFEEPFYRDHGVTAEFVGHPLAELPLPAITREQFAAENSLDPAKTWIGLLPGSRAKEIRDNLPEMLKAARNSPAGTTAALSSLCCRLRRPLIRPRGSSSRAWSSPTPKISPSAWSLTPGPRFFMPAPRSSPAARPPWKRLSSAIHSWWSIVFPPSPMPSPNGSSRFPT